MLNWADCECGVEAMQFAEDIDTVVIVDVFSFSTAVDIACHNGAVIIPYHYTGDLISLKQFALDQNAILAARRGQPGYSLSPSSLASIPRDTRLILPSPNGSRLCAEANFPNVVVGSLRNAAAIARYLEQVSARTLIVAAGERWPNDSMRFAYEDFVGAGAIISHLKGEKSYEASMAETLFNIEKQRDFSGLRNSKSAKELQQRSFHSDVDLALQYNISDAIPVLDGGAILGTSL